MIRALSASLLFTIIIAFAAGCAGYKITPIPKGCADDAWNGPDTKEGYVIYEPAPYLLANPSAAGGEEFQIIFLPDRTRPYRFTRYEAFAKSDLDITFKDGWQFTGAKSSTDSTAALAGLLELAKSLIPTRERTPERGETTPRLWRIVLDEKETRLEPVCDGTASSDQQSKSRSRDASPRRSGSRQSQTTVPAEIPAPVRAAAMGRAICVGLNRVDPNHYDGWSGQLSGCENDARDMTSLLKRCGFECSTLLTQDATLANVLGAMSQAAKDLVAGDYFVLTISSHGGEVPDMNGDEDDGLDETWCLFDGELLDDVVYGALKAFHEGVRVVVVSDSCHAGTPLRMTRADFQSTPPARLATLNKEFARLGREGTEHTFTTADITAKPTAEVIRAMPPEQCLATYLKNQAFYDELGRRAPRENRLDIPAAVLSLGACEDDETSADGFGNGLYTEWLKRTWRDGAFQGSFTQLQSAVRSAVAKRRAVQHPALDAFGLDSHTLEQQSPFRLVP